MTSIDDTLGAISAAVHQVEESGSAIGAADTEAGQTQGLLTSVGAEGPAGKLGLCRDALERAQALIHGVLECLEEASTAAESAAG